MKVIIIGTGIAGASAAYALARAGVDVVVLDANRDGAATLAGAGIIEPWTTSAEGDLYDLYVAGGHYYPSLVERLAADGETDIGYARVGGISVSTDDAALAAIERRLRRRAVDAPQLGAVTRLDPRPARECFPPLHPDYAAVHITGSARVDGRRLRAALLAAASRHGARHLSECAELRVADGRVTGVRTVHDTLAANEVIVAAGAWTNELLAPTGQRLAIAPQRGQITHLCLPGRDTSRWAVVSPPSSHYLLTFDDARVVVGATRESDSGFDYRRTAAGQAEVLNEALAVAPGLADATLLETRVGFRPLSADGKPWVGRLAEVAGLSVISGFGAAGLTMGPYVASRWPGCCWERTWMRSWRWSRHSAIRNDVAAQCVHASRKRHGASRSMGSA